MEASPRAAYLGALRDCHESGVGLAAECYRDPAFFELELERALRPAWHPVARWDALPDPGDYASLDLFGEPLVIVRDEARRLRVFSRVCRHRAHPVVEGCGNTRAFVCPYHRWTYGLDGCLRGAPLMMGTPGFDRTRHGLVELPTESWQGFVLASLDPDAPPIAGELSSLDERITPLGMAEMVSVGVLDFDSPWNWKVMVDNFMESYHHLGAHAETLQKTNPAKDTYCADLDGPFSLLENPGTNGAPGIVVFQVFPTLLAFASDGHPVGGWFEMQIDRHDHLHLRIHALSTPAIAGSEDAAELMSETLRQIHLEDIAVCEAVQRGLSSRLWRAGPLSAKEGCLVRFHRYLANQLGA